MSVIVFIDRLSLSVSSNDLHKLGEKYGTVNRAWIATRPGGTSLGFGYVEMSTRAAAQALTAEVNGLPKLPPPIAELDSECA